MPVTYEILRAGRVVLFTYSASFTSAEVANVYASFYKEVLDNSTGKVQTISDLTAVTQGPPYILSSSISMLKKPDPRIGTMFMVTHHSIIKKLVDILRKLFPNGGIIIHETVAEALGAADRLLAFELSLDTARESLISPVEI